MRFVAHLAGVEAAPGVYGTADLTQSFRIGNSLIAVVGTTRHYAKIYHRDKLFGVWPVSTGAPGDDNANGTYLTIDKENPAPMSGPGVHRLPRCRSGAHICGVCRPVLGAADAAVLPSPVGCLR